MSGDDRSPRDKRSRSRSRSNDDRRFKRRPEGDPRDRHEMRLIIRAKDAGAVIGRGGENVKRLRQEHKASITVTDSRTPERLIVIHADESGLEGIVKDVTHSLFELQNSRERSSKNKEEAELKMLIHHSQAGCVIGKAGAKLKDLRRELNVDIRVFPECCPRSTERLVMVTGKPDYVATCLVHILLMLKTWPPRGVVDFYDPTNYDDYLVPEYGGYYDDDDDSRRRGRRSGGGGRGGGGSGRRDMSRGSRDDRGGRGGYDDRDRGDRDFSSGPNLNRLSMMLTSVKTTQQVSIPAELAGVIIGKSGSNIRRIRNETGAEVDLDDAGGGKNDRVITINGTAEQIANAQYLLQMSVKQHLAKNSR